MKAFKNIIFFILLFLYSHLSFGQENSIFPANSWGVYSWTQFNSIDMTNAPLAKGGPDIMRWANVEPSNGVYAFDSEIGEKLRKAETNGFYTFLKIYFAAPSTGGYTPEWIYSNGVPRVVINGDVFPYYFSDAYKTFYYRMIREFGKYVLSLSPNLRKRVLFVQCTEGTTGDGGYYKGSPGGEYAPYAISKTQWEDFRLEAWKVFKEAFSKDGVLQVPLLTNNDANTDKLKDWMLAELPFALGVKNGMFTHGYQISDAQGRLADHISLRNQTEAVGKEFFARGEMDAEMNEKGWITQNKKQGLYWSGIYATHCGITMWNIPQDAIIGTTYADAMNFFNKYAAQVHPNTAKGAFCVFYRGLDASDTKAFPVDLYGTASKSNQARYIAICNAYKQFGAGMADAAAATGGGMTNRAATGYNDAGWQILKENFQRHITQIDAETTSDAWWQVDASVYGRFARGFNPTNPDKNSMYFDLDDQFFGNTPLNGSQGIEVAMTYRDSDPGSWDLKYDATDGTMKTAMTVTNSGVGTNVWKTQKVTINDAYLGNRGDKNADFILVNKGGTACRFHMIAMDKTGQIVFPLGVTKTLVNSDLKVQNNRTEKQLLINSQNEINDVELYTISGQKAKTIAVNGKTLVLPTYGYQSGIYFVKVYLKNKNLISEKVILN